MCNNYLPPSQRETYSPEEKLSRLMNRDLGCAVNKREVRLFIKANWSKISKLAHEIHDADQEK